MKGKVVPERGEDILLEAEITKRRMMSRVRNGMGRRLDYSPRHSFN